MSDARLVLIFAGFLAVYVVIGVRLTMLTAFPPNINLSFPLTEPTARPDILDRNGEILATDMRTASLYAEPKAVIDVDEASEQIGALLPNFDARALRDKLASGKGFVWIKREISPEIEAKIYALGLPGIGFQHERRRVYPFGRTVSHALGAVNIDHKGVAGLERHLDEAGLQDLQSLGFATHAKELKAARLSLDVRIQYALREELVAAMAAFKAKAAAGLVLDARTGEVLALISLPDYDPNEPAQAIDLDVINRATMGVFEMGSTFKAITTAMALDSGRVSIGSTFDARSPIRVGKFTISDFHGKNAVLSTPEVFIYSSNIGTAKMAMAVGVDGHKSFLRRMGLLDRLRTELPVLESAAPLVPEPWGSLNTMTIGFGHGLSVSAMHMGMAGSALVNGGLLMTPTFFLRDEAEAQAGAKQVVKPETSEELKRLLRLNVLKGSAKRADAAGYRVGGKTGTAEKVVNGAYSSDKRLTTFLGAFPMDDPRYVTFVMLDEPQGSPETNGAATSGLNAAPTTGRLISRIAPFLGVEKAEADVLIGR